MKHAMAYLRDYYRRVSLLFPTSLLENEDAGSDPEENPEDEEVLPPPPLSSHYPETSPRCTPLFLPTLLVAGAKKAILTTSPALSTPSFTPLPSAIRSPIPPPEPCRNA